MDSENVKDDSKDDKQVTNEMEKSTVAESEVKKVTLKNLIYFCFHY